MKLKLIAILPLLLSLWPISAKGYSPQVELGYSDFEMSDLCSSALTSAQIKMVKYLSDGNAIGKYNWQKPNFLFSRNEWRSFMDFYLDQKIGGMVAFSVYDVTRSYSSSTSLPKINKLDIAYSSHPNNHKQSAIDQSTQYKKEVARQILEACPDFQLVNFGIMRVTGTSDIYGREINSNKVLQFDRVISGCGDPNQKKDYLNWGEYWAEC